MATSDGDLDARVARLEERVADIVRRLQALLDIDAEPTETWPAHVDVELARVHETLDSLLCCHVGAATLLDHLRSRDTSQEPDTDVTPPD